MKYYYIFMYVAELCGLYASLISITLLLLPTTEFRLLFIDGVFPQFFFSSDPAHIKFLVHMRDFSFCYNPFVCVRYIITFQNYP